MKILPVVSISIVVACLIFGCKSNSKDDDAKKLQLENMPDSSVAKYLKSFVGVIEKSIPLRKRGFPTSEKGKSYFEERPYYDSSGKLEKVVVYEFRSDTWYSYESYYYWDEQFIAWMAEKKDSVNSLGMPYYIFNKQKVVDSAMHYHRAVATDSLLILAGSFKKKFGNKR